MTRPRRGIHRHRRAFQLTFLALFLVLLTLTVWPLGSVYLGAFLAADPLIAANSVTNGAVLPIMALALVMIALPLVLGRAFCGYVCPLGTLIELTGGTHRASRLSPKTRERLRRLPVLVLVACLGLMLFATGSFLLIDPLSTVTRTATVLLYPALDRMLRLTGDVLYLAPFLRPAVDAATSIAAGRLIFSTPLVFGMQLFALALFAGILGLSWFEPRLWCRDVCPLGALLGTVGRGAIVGRRVDTAACIECGRCRQVCPLDAVGPDFHSTDTSRCQLGLECADVCPPNAISVGLRPAKDNPAPSRRAFLGVAAASLTAGFFAYAGLGRRGRDPRLVRPPGAAQEGALLALCSRCGQCMKTCPTNVIQPRGLDGGLLETFTPYMDFRVGSCDWSCNECGKVCPTGALTALPLAEKRKTRIGRAYIDRNRCIPWADGKTCLVCQELCPVPEKAIVITPAETRKPDGSTVAIGRPEVVAERCIGCGVCENVCPVPHRSAVEVFALGPDELDG